MQLRLSHIACFPNYQPKNKYPYNYQTLKESAANIVNLPADALPGSKFNYGGLTMQVAGRMAEFVCEIDWETIFAEKNYDSLKDDFHSFHSC